MPASERSTRGPCAYCGRRMSAGGLSRHLRSCGERQAANARAQERAGARQSLYHLLVRDAHRRGCWLHLEMNGEADLWALDWYLREIWLECCGHMSAFRIGDRQFLESLDDFDDDRIGPLEARADTLFTRGLAFTYRYDFGTATDLAIRVVDERRGKPVNERPITLMARNDPVPIPCSECDQPASTICLACLYADPAAGHVCDRHVALHQHDDDDYGKLPVVNSPRSGVCAYTGPAETPC